MWNVLVVIVVALVIWMLNPLKPSDLKPTVGVSKKTQSEVNQAINEAQKQVDYSRQMQKEEQNQLNN